ncbi:glycosyltransferase family 2 protein [Candidatus Pelagibacter sp.]|jgi:glycosyltransferase involved in cell wall biosynthesis|nr:glycosyltransferase family 2 protein [Candidatus Pelagibacter sp.]
MEDLTLIIPAKNESASIVEVIDEIESHNLNYIIVVSKDDLSTINVIRNKNNIIYQENKGFGDAIISGINHLKTKYFAIHFADGSTDPAELSSIFNHLINKNSDFVFGSRYLKDASSEDDTIITLIGNKIFTLLGKIFFKLNISDILYTYILGKSEKAKSLNLKSKDFGICVEFPIVANRKGSNITDYPCHERKRISGKKNVNAFVDGFKILIKMIKLYFNKL